MLVFCLNSLALVLGFVTQVLESITSFKWFNQMLPLETVLTPIARITLVQQSYFTNSSQHPHCALFKITSMQQQTTLGLARIDSSLTATVPFLLSTSSFNQVSPSSLIGELLMINWLYDHKSTHFTSTCSSKQDLSSLKE